MNSDPRIPVLSRRTFLRGGNLLIAAPFLSATATSKLFAKAWHEQDAQDEDRVTLRLGLITDLHYADKPPAGTRYYRETLAKLDDAAAEFARHEPRYLIELGDLVDAAESVEAELASVAKVREHLDKIPGEKHFVLGNHCVHTLSKREFLEGVEQQEAHHSFDADGWHVIILDACYRADGVPYGHQNFDWKDTFIPQDELDWLREDLKAASAPTLVFVHQRLDVTNQHGVKNAPAVREILESVQLDGSPAVRAVLQGHSHANDLKEHNGIPYCTLHAMVEGSGADNNGYSLLEVLESGSLRLRGFRKQEDRSWGHAGAKH